MKNDVNNVLIVYDDREFSSDHIKPLIGIRRYSEIIYRGRHLQDDLFDRLSDRENKNVHTLRDSEDVSKLRKAIEDTEGDIPLLLISARAGIVRDGKFEQLLARLPYAEDNFCDRLFRPLLVFWQRAGELLESWQMLDARTLPNWEQPLSRMQRLNSIRILDLAISQDFLLFMSGATPARHFNQIEIDAYYYRKSSTNKAKIEAEYRYYSFVPESMRTWLVQPFEFKSEAETASYKMTRYYIADAAVQWVHGAFDISGFISFIERLLFFMSERPRKFSKKSVVAETGQQLFVNKLMQRCNSLLDTPEGEKINRFLQVSNQDLTILTLVERVQKLYQKFEKQFVFDYLVVGHGDPCFSNLLYDQQRHLLKAVDPMGAMDAADIWTHPLYDLCKIAHSILGDYDFINNGLYSVSLSTDNQLRLNIEADTHLAMKEIFLEKLTEQGYKAKSIRLGEASLFLSMLPLHIDHPRKLVAFVLNAKRILDEVEYDA